MEEVHDVIAGGETELNVWRNNIGDEGCAHLATALQSARCTVTALKLYFNNIGAEGCAHLATALHLNSRTGPLLDGPVCR